jgi:WD40 repeat protein
MDDTKKPAEPKELRVFESDRQVRTARFSPCGKYLFAGCYDSAIRRWDLTGEEARSLEPLEGHRGWLESSVFCNTGVLYSVEKRGQLCAWDWDQEKPMARWSHQAAHDGWIRSLTISADGKMLGTCGQDHVVRIWSSSDGRLLNELKSHQHEAYCVAIHPSGKSAASGDMMGNLKCWDLTTGKCVRETRLESMHFYDRIQDVAGLRILQFQDDGKSLICAGSDPTKAGRAFGIPTLRRLDWNTLETKSTWQHGPDKNGYIFDLHRHPDGYYMLVTCGPPGAGKFLFVRPGEEKPFYEHTKMYNTHCLAVHFESRRAIVAATNRSSQGNGAVLDKEGKYLGNTSPLHEFELPA